MFVISGHERGAVVGIIAVAATIHIAHPHLGGGAAIIVRCAISRGCRDAQDDG